MYSSFFSGRRRVSEGTVRANEAVRLGLLTVRSMSLITILAASPAGAWERTGVVGDRGDRSIAQMVDGAVQHLAHHLAFVAEKRRALDRGDGGRRSE